MGRTARTYGDEIDVAIWAALCIGLGPEAVRRRLQAGTLDGLEGPCSMSERTFYKHVEKLREKHGHERDAGPVVQAGSEMSTADAILRRALALCLQEIEELEAARARNKHGLTSAQAARLGKLMRDVQGYRARELAVRRQDRNAASKDPEKRGAGLSHRGKGETAIDRLKREHAKRAAGENGTDPEQKGEEGDAPAQREPVPTGPHAQADGEGTHPMGDGRDDARRDAGGTERDGEGEAASQLYARAGQGEGRQG